MNEEVNERLRRENQDLRRRAEEAENIVRALHTGEADAIFVAGDREAVYILGTPDYRYRLLVDHMPYSAATLTVEGKIIHCNDRFGNMLRLPLDTLPGRPIEDFIVPESIAPVVSLLRDCQNSETSSEIIFLRGDGIPISIYLCARMRNEGARGFCVVITDLTEQRHYQQLQQTQEALRASEEQLRLADKKKDEFIATLAHELRNPLATITNATALVGKSDVKTAQWAKELIDRQLSHMNRLLNDLLDVSRISTGKIRLEKKRIELAQVIGEAIETSKILMEKNGHFFEATLPPEPTVLDADPERLAQVLMNLLNNSAKYTKPGGRIALKATKKGDEVIVSIKDTGIGISPEKLPHIFEMFFQADDETEKTSDGLGIGLSLAKQFVELHGGRLEALSEGLGKGSEFIVRLPILPINP